MDMLAAKIGRRPSQISQEVASCGSSSVSERQDHICLWSQRTITAFSTLNVMLLKSRSRICVRVHGSYPW